MKKILLIEDNHDVRENIAEILELADYDVLQAENGKLGVESAKQHKPDLVICDIMMPELDGYGVLRILSKNPETAAIPFIFLTARAEKSDVRKGMNLGADDYITKPFEEAELLEAVETRLRKTESMKKDFGSGIEGLNRFINEARGLDELKDLPKDRKTKSFHKKEVVYREGDFANYMYYIISGKVKCLKTDEHGKELVNDIFKPGDFIGYLTLLDEGEYNETATALEDTEVAVIPRQDFQSLIRKNRDVAIRFIQMLSGKVQQKEKRLLQLAYAPVRERVAEALLQLSNMNRAEDGTTITLRISREDLAGMVGTAKESLIRTLSDFKKEGIISAEGQEIVILHEQKLLRASGEL